MIARAFVAGVGNVFFGDDAFGVEVARRLAPTPPVATRVADFGIRALHLAYALLAPVELCIIADCVARGGPPGTLYVIDPVNDAMATGDPSGAIATGHAMDLAVVFAAVRELGGQMPPTLVVGCEPASIDPGMGLSDVVARAVPEAVSLIRELVVFAGAQLAPEKKETP